MIDEFKKLVSEQLYPTKKEWFYKYGKHGVDYDALLKYKKEHSTSIPLKTTEGTLYFNSEYILPKMKEYYSIQTYGFEVLSHFTEQFEEILIFSEVEGTLEIEGVKTSKKKIEEVLRKPLVVDTKEQVIVNMKNGMDYIFNHDITEENLHELYTILSYNSLRDDEKIESGFYRAQDVEIIGRYGEVSDRGVDASLLAKWMGDFVSFVQESMLSLNNLTYLMPHIIHYYMIYLHPYYDFNGRMARIFSYWYILKCPFIKEKLPVFSEAINYNSTSKTMYYRAIENAREDGNDLTYFLDYLFTVGKRFVDVYLKLDLISTRSNREMMKLTSSELNTLKSILLYVKEENYFTWEDVSGFDKEHYSKQYYLRLLNSLEDKGILLKVVKGKSFYFQFKR
ncbi:MAG: Fic family protein [Erysipelotrichaceae bacterium]